MDNYNYLENAAAYLKELRKPRPGIITNYINSRLPIYAKSTVQTDYLKCFEQGWPKFYDAVEGSEPARTIFLLYIEALRLTKQQKEKLQRLLGNHAFDLTPNADTINRLIENYQRKKMVKSLKHRIDGISEKLYRLKPDQINEVEDLVDRLKEPD